MLGLIKFFKQLFKNETPTQVFPVDIVKFLRIAFLKKTSGGCFWKSYHNTVKSAGVLFFDFAPSRAFEFDKKRTQNVAQIILDW